MCSLKDGTHVTGTNVKRQNMEQILRDFCQNYAMINNQQSEVEAKIDEFATGVRNVSNMGSAKKRQASAASPSAQPLISLKLTLNTIPTIDPHTPPPYIAVPSTPDEPTDPSTSPPPILGYHHAQQCQFNLPPLLYHSITFASVLGSNPEQPKSALAVRDEIADFTVVDR